MKRKIVAMIPCRLGSQRVPKKNLRLIKGRTLSQWIATTCRESKVFDEVYINSESEIFAQIAADCGVKFYKRPAELASNSATNDQFALDFIENVKPDVLVQVNPTTPFMSKENIQKFVDMFLKGGYQTLHTVKNEQIEGLFNGKPLNFDPTKQMPPSQELTPVQVFTSSIMAWDAENFCKNMKQLGCAVYGGDGNIGYYVMKGLESTMDIDNEQDFQLAEILANRAEVRPLYYGEN